MHTLTLRTPAHPGKIVPITIGKGVMQTIRREDIELYDAIHIISDRAVGTFAGACEKMLKSFHPRISHSAIQGGESAKSITMVETISKEFLQHGLSRRSLLIAIGGGSITDLAGFVGGAYMRGIAVWLFPTTTLAIADAAIGGKTGVNVGAVKNVIGSFSQPIAVTVDTDVLTTLPDPLFREGFVEVVKMAAMLDAESFAWLENHLATILRREESAVEECLVRAIRMKGKVVEHDEREADLRKSLNFGHTVGHAIESLTAYRVSHGDAVSIGMVAEMRLPKPINDTGRIENLLRILGTPTSLPPSLHADQFWDVMLRDKKASNNEVMIAVPHPNIGSWKLQSILLEDLRRIAP